ncbi:hypothetical protein DM02DRAFT_278269 [Periconia macrospinosa]|uniref:Uncharacterized protein n=1 Tax=Periconia macrospinosa TaxID=97972 RepID=A0A2V1D2Y7_9PLEO|nr:hypothetical protein DM02DRAFT_278269 [Periconia macrospinosa]
MSATSLLSQLKGLLIKSQQLRPKFHNVHPSDDQWDELTKLSLSLSEAAKTIGEEIQTLKQSRSERAWKESEKHRLNAQSLRGDVFAKGRLKNPHVFRRNIITVFNGPKDSKFDSEDVKMRKESTRNRCASIRELGPDGIISWAIAFPPTLWAGGSMASDIFTCLHNDIEPDLVQTWPPVINEMLRLLREDEESLKDSSEYHRFLKEIDDTSRKPRISRKRKYPEDENVENIVPTNFVPPSREDREMKHMYTNGPASEISKFPEPFKTAIQNSRLWKWERSQELLTTGCWATLFPKGDTQDVSFTIWSSHEDGYHLNDVFGLQHAISS